MTKAERLQSGHIARLAIWNQIFHGLPVSLADLDPIVLCGDEDSGSERGAYVTLRACVSISHSARQAMRCALRIAILYWFSNVGDHRDDGAVLDARRSTFHLGEAIGTHLTWDEAVAAMKRKPVDFSAYLKLLEVVEEEYAWQWSTQYPETTPYAIDILAGDIRNSEHAQSWTTGMRDRPAKGGRHV